MPGPENHCASGPATSCAQDAALGMQLRHQLWPWALLMVMKKPLAETLGAKRLPHLLCWKWWWRWAAL